MEIQAAFLVFEFLVAKAYLVHMELVALLVFLQTGVHPNLLFLFHLDR
jgi:hypothetical protein